MSKQEHCQNLAKSRRGIALAKAIEGIYCLEKKQVPVTFDTLATISGVSRSWLYKEPVIKELVERLQLASSQPDSHLLQLLDTLEDTLNCLKEIKEKISLIRQSSLNSIESKEFE